MTKGRLRVVMISAEVESFARTGGLGDAVEALARALAELGADVIVVTPLYGVTKVPTAGVWWDAAVFPRVGEGPHDARECGVLEAPLAAFAHGGRARVCLLANDALYARRAIYADAHGVFADNPLRFATLSRGALEIAARAWPDGGPDVLHAHDWHAALAVIYAKLVMGEAWRARPSVFTIHNLAFQGVLERDQLGPLGIPREAFDVHAWLAHEGRVNLMKGAIELADRVTTVSATYAREIKEPAHGYGLDACLRLHAAKLVGIVNGIDARSFDPSADRAIPATYDVDTAPSGKRACKRALLAEAGLDGDVDAPLFATVSRLTWQKGIDLIVDALPTLVARGAALLLVGQGDEPLERLLRGAEAKHPGRVATKIAFDPALARRVFAGADFFMVPSRYEPCGLTQMYAMRYGAIPIVTSVGGLRDTVTPVDLARGLGTGIVAPLDGPHPLVAACEEALSAYGDRAAWSALVRRAMMRDSAWVTSAKEYVRLYEEIVR